MPGRAPSIVAAVLGLAAGAGLWIVGSVPTTKGPSRDDVVRIADDLDNKLREVVAGLRARATTLADLPRIPRAVATDAATVKDLTQEELSFRPSADETIELAQITATNEVKSLWKQPETSRASPPLDKPGTLFLPDDKGNVLVSVVVHITPSVDTGVKAGRLAVTWPVDLAPFVAKLGVLNAPARIEFDGRSAGATPIAFPAGVEPTVLPLKSATARIVAVVQEAGGGLSPLQLGGIGAAALGLLGAALLWWRPAKKELPLALAPTGEMPGTPAPGITPSGVPSPAGAARAFAEIGEFGRYALLRKLGSGGMAEVYLARSSGEAGFEKKVALKIIHKHLSAHPQVVDHFLDEARLASRLAHPNIAQIIDLGKSGEDYFIAMEFVDGYDLDTLVDMASQRGAPVPARVALSILRKICDGLHAAHTAFDVEGKPLELVHRDVKAENILVSRVGEIKVTDFGIAKANVRVARTQIGMVKGTAAYMAPEQRIGQPVDKRADVYGVGAIAYELFTGQEVNLDLATLAHLGREGWPHLQPISQQRPDVPPEIDAIVFKALAYEKEDRWPSCQLLEEELERYATRHGLLASDKVVAQWVEQEIGYLEAQARSGGMA